MRNQIIALSAVASGALLLTVSTAGADGFGRGFGRQMHPGFVRAGFPGPRPWGGPSTFGRPTHFGGGYGVGPRFGGGGYGRPGFGIRGFGHGGYHAYGGYVSGGFAGAAFPATTVYSVPRTVYTPVTQTQVVPVITYQTVQTTRIVPQTVFQQVQRSCGCSDSAWGYGGHASTYAPPTSGVIYNRPGLFTSQP